MATQHASVQTESRSALLWLWFLTLSFWPRLFILGFWIFSNLLSRAYNHGDAARVKLFFKSYLAETRLPAAARTAERLPYESGRPTPSITKADLAPRKLWRREEIAAFYRDVQKGRYAGREVEKLKVEQSIAKAARENRIANPPAAQLSK